MWAEGQRHSKCKKINKKRHPGVTYKRDNKPVNTKLYHLVNFSVISPP